MALQTSGAISLGNIQGEFGGAGSHSLSEYRALNALGVTDIPATGPISFDDFYGTSNQVSTTVGTPYPAFRGTSYTFYSVGTTTEFMSFGQYEVAPNPVVAAGIAGSVGEAGNHLQGYEFDENGTTYTLGTTTRNFIFDYTTYRSPTSGNISSGNKTVYATDGYSAGTTYTTTVTTVGIST